MFIIEEKRRVVEDWTLNGWQMEINIQRNKFKGNYKKNNTIFVF